MKKIIIKVLRKLVNMLFKVLNGFSYDSYKAAISNRSFDSMSSTLLWMIDGIHEKYPDFKVDDAKVGEIGSGQFLSHPIAYKVLGAREVISFDLYRQFDQKLAKVSFSQNVMAKKIFSKHIASHKYTESIKKLNETDLNLKQLDKHNVKYLAPFDLHDFEDDAVFELISSYTVLEHVPPRDTIPLLEKSIKMLKIGGYFCHFIDLEDHKDHDNKPFEFLTIDNWGDSDCFSRGNKLRINEWKDIFDSIENIEFDFTYTLERDKDLLPKGVEKQLNNYVSGILVVGRRVL